MNIFELAGCAGGAVGAFVGGMVGNSLFGTLGAIGGVPVGAIAGIVVGVGGVGLCCFVGIAKERIEQHRALRPTFGKYWAREREAEWQSLTKSLTLGQELSGKVVSQFYYGVFIDTGHDFPAHLAIGYSEGGINAPQAAVGASVSAKFLRCDDATRFIELAQTEEALELERRRRKVEAEMAS